MSLDVSWWLLALVVGGSAHIWVRVVAKRWQRGAKERTDRVMMQFARESGIDED